ncbi:MAG: hypothetical protein V5A31_13740 [Haloferacaceae archaeon]
MDGLRRLYDRVRDPAYTGRNRCTACTVVNAVLAAAAAGLVAVVSPPLAVLVLVVAAAVVALRGYLVPGTPALTHRCLPDRIHALFEAGDVPTEDPGAALVALGVLDDPADPSLTPWFRRRHAAALARYVGDALAVDPASVAFEAAPDGDGVVATVDGDWVGAWPSRAALVADAATDAVLSARPAWTDLDHAARADLAGRVRGFVDDCPACGGNVVDSNATVDSCCRSVEVLARSCAACDARVVELERDREAFAPGS